MKTKHVKFSYSQAIQLANWAIEIFYHEEEVYGFAFEDFWKELKEEIIVRLSKPHKKTILHYYLEYVDGFVEHDISTSLRNHGSSDYETFINYVIKLIEEVGNKVEYNDLDFNLINECGHCEECEECTRFKVLVDYLILKQDEINPIVINSTFHLLMLNKSFLRDFHERLAKQLIHEGNDLIHDYPEMFNEGSKVKRVKWPIWLKKGLFYRDNGVCVICRTDLTGVINLGGDYEIDHIVPISKYGSNDPSNLQILCKNCNLRKLNNSSLISVYAVPLWDT
ncbi:HNH endonuclease [Paenibacillus thalictri]|uniref:HNH endonuclease n=1 Tax=Paenibacillus thalictri TaxID=2527873 RepID=A0A4Q9DBZ2_9BACL|nr:HNH endonuclease signature motif containing protein [Paenibacillus thalictri]TBL67448.1 HNH endonuclease [Paenibacillus thalictri]